MTNISSVIDCDPDILGGTPVFAGTRVPVQTMLDYVHADALEQFFDDFPTVGREQAAAALELLKQANDSSESHPYPCTLCGRAVQIELGPDSGDALCPYCGQLLWRAPRRLFLFIRFALDFSFFFLVLIGLFVVMHLVLSALGVQVFGLNWPELILLGILGEALFGRRLRKWVLCQLSQWEMRFFFWRLNRKIRRLHPDA
jgi:uncharacterized protein (DUF433 family)